MDDSTRAIVNLLREMGRIPEETVLPERQAGATYFCDLKIGERFRVVYNTPEETAEGSLLQKVETEYTPFNGHMFLHNVIVVDHPGCTHSAISADFVVQRAD